jgi:hypothetical protein
MGLMAVADKANQNLTATQKELLQWCWKLGHCSFQWIKVLAAKPQDRNKQSLLQAKNNISLNLSPLCAACQLAKQKRRGPETSIEFKIEDWDILPRQNQTELGDYVSIHQYVSPISGRFLHTKDKETKDEKWNRGTIFVDHTTGYGHREHQVSMRAGETIASESKSEKSLMQHGVQVKRYWADQPPF